MTPATPRLRPVAPPRGKPKYSAVRDAVQAAIDAGLFQPGQQMPSTQDLGEQMEVSLVTAHRALQELVTAGVLQRSQGKGTFVNPRYAERRDRRTTTRIGLVFEPVASLADFYHSQILEGVRQAAHAHGIDLILLRLGEDARNECNGYLCVNPLPADLEAFGGTSDRRQPVLVVGARSHLKKICSIDVDNVDLASRAVRHLCGLGHTKIGYVGGGVHISNSRDRWNGFVAACKEQGVATPDRHILKGASWRLDDRERMNLVRMLSGRDRPTAVFAAGYYFALDVYGAAATIGLRIPEELSVVGVDDPPSAALLSPPMTTLRQPLVQLGHAALTALYERVRDPAATIESRQLRAELMIRRSSGTVPGAAGAAAAAVPVARASR